MITYPVLCLGVTKTNRPIVKKKLFSPNSSSPLSSKGNISSEMNEVAVSLNKLSCGSKEKDSLKGKGGRSAQEEGFDLAGKGAKSLTKEKAPRGGWSAGTGKQRTGGSEEESDNWEGGWEKVKGGWGKQKTKGGWKDGRGQKKKYSLLDGFDDDMSPDFVPSKKRTVTKIYKVSQSASVYTQPDQKLRGTKQNLFLLLIRQ